jgi:outer membrane immunogenic protein
MRRAIGVKTSSRRRANNETPSLRHSTSRSVISFNRNFSKGGAFAPSSEQASQNMRLFGTVRGRVGYLGTPTLLVYGTGGLAYAELDNTFSTTNVPAAAFGTFSTSHNNLVAGWAAGAGFEWLLSALWSAKVEYLYYRFRDNLNLSFAALPNGAGTFVNHDFKNDGHIVRFGLNKFGQ